MSRPPRRPPTNYDSEKAECRDCRYRYLWNESEDRKLHREFHDEWQNGARYVKRRDENVVEVEKGIEYLLVDQDSSEQQRALAAQVARIANRESRYDFPSYDGGSNDQETGALAIIARLDRRAIGLLVLRPCYESAHVTWPDYETHRQPELQSPIERWMVEFLWVRRDLRRRGIGLSLIRLAARVVGITVDDFAWQVPIEPGAESLLRTLLPDGIWIE